MTKPKYEPVTDTDLDMIDMLERYPDMPASPELLRRCLFQMAQHIRNLHDTSEKSFNAGMEFHRSLYRCSNEIQSKTTGH